MKSIFTFLFFSSIPFLLLSQEIDEKQEPNYIKSVELRSLRSNSFLPIIKLGESLILKFDDTEGDQKDYHYTIIHCTYDWKNSNLNPTDYSNGFAEDRIRNFDNSFNTFLDYTHYELTLPNTQVQLKITGNYLISIYDEYDDLIFTRKFIVYEPKVDVGVSVHKAKKVSNINTKQNVEFTINHPNFRFDNPSQEVKTTLYRNIDWNSKISNVKPQFIRNGQLLYKYDTETTFWAGNEFLFFDTKEYRIATNNIRRSELKNGIFHTRLYVDETRARKPYTYYPDINGNFVIRSLNTENPNFEAEYTQVHFFLDYSNPDKKEVYVYGAFNNWQLNEENLMHYNEATKLYETSFLFKQGFYNYYYVTLDEDESINIVDVNGSFYQTENDYQVLVYYHKFGAKYDEVIGLGIGNSVNLQN